MSTEQNKAIVRQMVDEIFNQGNTNLVTELISPDFVEHEELPPGMPSGRDGFGQAIAMLHGVFPDFKATIDDMVAEGDKVTLRLTWTGTQQGEFMGIPPAGKSISIGVFDILRIVDGQIVEHWGLMDTMTMMQQLGAMPGPE